MPCVLSVCQAVGTLDTHPWNHIPNQEPSDRRKTLRQEYKWTGQGQGPSLSSCAVYGLPHVRGGFQASGVLQNPLGACTQQSLSPDLSMPQTTDKPCHTTSEHGTNLPASTPAGHGNGPSHREYHQALLPSPPFLLSPPLSPHMCQALSGGLCLGCLAYLECSAPGSSCGHSRLLLTSQVSVCVLPYSYETHCPKQWPLTTYGYLRYN